MLHMYINIIVNRVLYLIIKNFKLISYFLLIWIFYFLHLQLLALLQFKERVLVVVVVIEVVINLSVVYENIRNAMMS
jgi:hypothetical protein